MSTAFKVLAAAGLSALLLIGFLVTLGANVSEPAGSVQLPGLSSEVAIDWYETGGRPPRITAATDRDAFTGLGFAQAQKSAWTLMLWRQAAAGRLAEWYGPSALPADRVARQLGLRKGAAAATGSISRETRAQLEAFVAGINAGMRTDRFANDPQLTLLGIRTEPFDVADVLAIERLLAWLGARTPPPAGTARWPDLASWQAGDARLRSILRVDGLDRSRIWTYADSSEARLVASYVTGSSALPIFFDAEVQVGRRNRLGVFLYGTPFAVAGAERASPDSSATRAWAAYPVSTSRWQPSGADSLSRRAERFLIEGGQESVQLVMQSAKGLFFRGPARARPLRPRPASPLLVDTLAAAPIADTTYTPQEMAARLTQLRQARRADSLWRADSIRAAIPTALALDWQGFAAGTDADAWMALWNGREPAFRLFQGGYLTNTSAQGAAAYARGGLLSDSTWRPDLLARLSSLDSLPSDPLLESINPFAAALNRQLVARVDTAKLTSPIQREAYAYARSWTGSYEATSVAATLFDTWTAAEARVNRLDRQTLASDTAFFASVRRTKAFAFAVDSLQKRFGPDLRTWRWSESVPSRRTFAGYAIPGRTLPAARRYASFEVAAGGHPSTLTYGPEDAQAPVTTYALDVPLGGSEAPRLLRFDFDPNRFLARYRLSTEPAPVAVTSLAPRERSRLLPR